ncbi:MAG: hypothetical protein BWY07_00630 [Candidatus Hydrogenedentes bacterium ADurb.Bin170]|jgi:hypothetical protein|nr:MAG: hypothetical protein BWY07_00630 [Candidatus Hydrogenedentes bacterium ADurb.Bin170]
MNVRFLFLSVLFASLFIYQQQAHAYLDPSSGSVLIQIILGGVAGFFVLLKIYWRRIRRALGLYKEDSHPENVSDE